MASGMSPREIPEPEIQIVAITSGTISSPAIRSSSNVEGAEQENYEPFGSFDNVTDDEGLMGNIGFIDDQMLMDVLQENNVIDRKVVLPPSVELHSPENIEEDEVQVIFEGVKRPHSHNKLKGNQAREFIKLTVSNGLLTRENKSLREELEDLKLEVAHQKSFNLVAQFEQNKQILDVLNSELTCVICSDIIIEAVAIDCGHIFCSHCISTWFAQQAITQSCPTCRSITYKDPIKISHLTSTIASFHNLLSHEAQSEREKLLEDRQGQVQKAQQEASLAARSRTRRTRHLDISGGLPRGRLTRLVHHRLHRLSPDITASNGSSSGQGQATSSSAQAQAQVDPPVTLSSPLVSAIYGGYNPVRPHNFPSNAPRTTAPLYRPYDPALALRMTSTPTPVPRIPFAMFQNQAPADPVSNNEEIPARVQQEPRQMELNRIQSFLLDYVSPDPRVRPY